jgi:hypothetical protein
MAPIAPFPQTVSMQRQYMLWALCPNAHTSDDSDAASIALSAHYPPRPPLSAIKSCRCMWRARFPRAHTSEDSDAASSQP